jgi:hypothetical protein
MTLGRPIQPLQLSREERETRERWVRRPTSAQGFVLAGAGHPEPRGRENEHEGGAAALWRGVWMGCWMSRGPSCACAKFQEFRLKSAFFHTFQTGRSPSFFIP